MLGFGVLVHIAQIFLAVLAPFLAVSLTYCWVEGHQRALSHSNSKPHMGVATVTLCLAFCPGFRANLSENWPFSAEKICRFRRAPTNLAPKLRAATGKFVAQNFDFTRPSPGLQDDLFCERSEALAPSNAQNSKETCCCCLLLAKFKGRGV